MKPKILIIGMDGATFDVIDPLIEQGRLPNLAGLIGNGTRGNLHSTIHPITPQAWSTLLTGRNAGKHGIFDFVVRKENSYDIEFINAGNRASDSMFYYLSRLGMKVGSVAVPFTYPPEPVNGFMLSGIDAPAEDARAVYPKDLYNEIKRRFGNYYIHLASPVGRKKDESKFWEDIIKEDRNRTDIVLYLMKEHPCELLMVTYNNTDRVQHQYLTFDFLEALRKGNPDTLEESLLIKTYENTDREIGRLLDTIDDNTIVLILSDHGSGPIRKVFYLNRWLEQHGYLYYRQSGGKSVRTIERIRSLSKRILPRWAKGFIKGMLPQVRDRVESYRYFSEIDWEKTSAYGFGMYGNIFINRKGREPNGVVLPEDAEKVCQEISRELLDLSDPNDGKKIVETVHRGDNLYTGPHTDRAPDLIIQWRDYSYYTATGSGRETDDVFGDCTKIDSSEFDHVGTHRINGIFAANGSSIRKGQVLQKAHISDIAPTVLFALGKPIPKDMDGKILFEIFTNNFLQNRKAEYTSPEKSEGGARKNGQYTEKESKDVEKRLKGLGYL